MKLRAARVGIPSRVNCKTQHGKQRSVIKYSSNREYYRIWLPWKQKQFEALYWILHFSKPRLHGILTHALAWWWFCSSNSSIKINFSYLKNQDSWHKNSVAKTESNKKRQCSFTSLALILIFQSSLFYIPLLLNIKIYLIVNAPSLNLHFLKGNK